MRIHPNLRKAAGVISRRVIFKRRRPADIGGISLYVSSARGLRYMNARIESVDSCISVGLSEKYCRPRLDHRRGGFWKAWRDTRHRMRLQNYRQSRS